MRESSLILATGVVGWGEGDRLAGPFQILSSSYSLLPSSSQWLVAYGWNRICLAAQCLPVPALGDPGKIFTLPFFLENPSGQFDDGALLTPSSCVWPMQAEGGGRSAWVDA